MKTLRSISMLMAMFALLAPAAAAQRAAQKRQPGQRAAGKMPEVPPHKGVMHNGKPALEFEGQDGWGFYVVMGPHQGEPSLGFAVAQGDCQGMVFVTRTRVSGDFQNTKCNNFDVPRTGSTAEREPGKIVIASGDTKYELTPQGERGSERRAVRGMGTGAEFLLRAVNNFDIVFRNIRRMAMESQAQPPAQPSAPAKAAAQQPAQGTLTITSDPGDVQVYVNDEPKGMTSSEGREVLPLPAGAYRVRLSLPGYKDLEQEVTLAAGKNQDLTAKLETVGPPPFTAGDVTEMLQGKMSPKRIATLVQERGVDFEVNPDVEKKFRAAGATSDLLLTIATNKKK